MQTIRVDFFEMPQEGDKPNPVGYITWDGSSFGGKFDGPERMMRETLDDPLYLGKELIRSKDEPEKFMENLYRYYRSHCLYATKPYQEKK